MDFVVIFWSAAAGISAALAIVSGAVGMTARENSSSLTLCVLGLAVAAAAYLELCMMHSSTAAEFGDWLPAGVGRVGAGRAALVAPT